MNSLSNFSKYFELSKLLVEYHVALVTKVSQQFYNSTQVDIL